MNLRREPWSEVVRRAKGGRVLKIPCVVCGQRFAIRYWDPVRGRGVCAGCAPAGAPIRRQPDSPSHQRPMALGGD